MPRHAGAARSSGYRHATTVCCRLPIAPFCLTWSTGFTFVGRGLLADETFLDEDVSQCGIEELVKANQREATEITR